MITYLANSVQLGEKSAPYSFVAAIPPSVNIHVRDNEIIINKWLAEDIGAGPGDTLKLTWFDPGSGLLLKEESRDFIVGNVLNMNSELSDPSLMPDFPGISGSTTCSGWDAGVPILLDRIREKDEDYWNKFGGTPKAFISYNTGVRLWGNNFGRATAIRFPRSMSAERIEEALNGSIDPLAAGFSISDVRTESQTAAGSGVDFSSLFLSLGIFIILSCIILLSFAISIFFDSRKQQIRTYHALGFKNRFIGKTLFLETIFHTIIGAVPGVFTGYFINILIIRALNSVWSGAVQTNTLTAQFGLIPVISGFAATFIISALLIIFKVRNFLKKLGSAGTSELHIRRQQRNLLFLILSFLTASVILILSFSLKSSSATFSFISGSFFFLSFVLAMRQYYIGSSGTGGRKYLKNNYSRKFYSFYPSQAVTPVIFIAAGIFAVIITGANRQVLTEKMMTPSGGTGGFLLWMETAVPVTDNLNLSGGRAEFGLDEPELRELKFVQADKLNGDDASCLNLNHVTSPPLLGIDPGEFISRGSFSFASVSRAAGDKNPWGLLNENPAKNKIYGIADQTVMQWGLKVRIGDTLKYRS